MHELSKQFRFDAAHTLHRDIDAEPSRRVHGHSYRAEVVVRGRPDPETGMIIDLGHFERLLEAARDDARLIVERDPGLRSPRGQALRVLLYLFEREAAIRLIGAG